MPQLDALRAVAALMVMYYHFLPDFGFTRYYFLSYGVQFFFVLSGFLITLVLLRQKEAVSNKLLIVKNFVIKRALRLFPIYYLVIGFFTILSALGLYVWDQGDAIFYYTYTANILFAMEGMKGIQLNHVWTLAIEEQFYLVWPWLLLFIPMRKELFAIVFMVIGSVAYKMTFLETQTFFLTISHLDTLGLGCFLGYMTHYRPGWPERALRFMRAPGLVVVALAVGYFAIDWYLTERYNVRELFVLALSFLLVLMASVGFKGVMQKVLEQRWILHLGKISYGIYLYHKFMPYFIKLVLPKVGIDLPNWLSVFIATGLTIGVAHFSYLFIEKRFIGLKAKYDL